MAKREIPGPGLSLAISGLYPDAQGPKFAADYAPPSPAIRNGLVVVSYNIRAGREVEKAGEALQSFDELKEADIVLLQEMDEAGVEAISKFLELNYIYYPAFVSRDGRNVGNAILARWPFVDSDKIILPHRHPLSGQQRIAVRGTVRLNGQDLFVYSAHTETFSTIPAHRKEQVMAIVDDIGRVKNLVIVGGDFNTVTSRNIRSMTAQFAAIGLPRVSAGSGPTISKFGINRVVADHIFARGFVKIASGTVPEVEASDHFPLWVRLNRIERSDGV